MSYPANSDFVVAYIIRSYLFLTGSWIYGQLRHLEQTRAIVLTTKTENLDIFPFDPLFVYREITDLPGLAGAGLRVAYETLTSRKTKTFAKIARERGVNLLHAHFGTEGYYQLPLKRELDLPLITTFYGSDISKSPRAPKWRRRYLQLFDQGDLFLAEGSHMAQCAVDLGCPPTKVKMIHLGVDLNKIEYLPRNLDESNEVRLLMAASYREKKGIPYALKAFIKASKEISNLKLTIIGGATTKEEYQLLRYCKDLVSKEKLTDKVRFLGYLQYPQYLLEQQNSHLFLAPSVTASSGDTEGGAPVSIIEASAAGMPVISTFHCDIPEVVIDNKSGTLVRERDVSALSAAILNLAESPEIWEQMGKAGRSHIEKEYDVKKQVAKLENIYNELV